MHFRIVSLSLAFTSAISLADVVGKKVEVLGNQWAQTSYSSWLKSDGALITPESTNLAIQGCFRKAQEETDPAAYALTKALVKEMDATYKDAQGKYDRALASVTELLKRIDAIKELSQSEFISACKTVVKGALGDKALMENLAVAFEGRLNPDFEALPDLPKQVQDVIIKLAKKGLKPAPLKVDGMPDHFCELEGYYSTSLDESLWKFFALTRVMGSVLPSTAGHADFMTAAQKSDKVVDLVSKLNRYSSVAGKYNGPTLGMGANELEATGPRLTGVALGSNTTSFMAYFTTAWREKIQMLVLDQDQYPEKPFRLLSANDFLTALKAELVEKLPKGNFFSQTHLGMASAASSLEHDRNAYGDSTTLYRRAAVLAWLALNAETNIRVNEKITGISLAAAPQPNYKASLYGSKADYTLLADSIKAAVRAYAEVDKKGELTPWCVKNVAAFTEAAQKLLKEDTDTVVPLQSEQTGLLDHGIELNPVIAHLGLEIDDQVGNAPAGSIQLHIATGRGRKVPGVVDGKSYSLFTPSAIVLHSEKQMTTAGWYDKNTGKGSVTQYDK